MNTYTVIGLDSDDAWGDGANPSIEVYRFAEMRVDGVRLTIKGQRLVNLAREIFKIPFPDERLQLDLF